MNEPTKVAQCRPTSWRYAVLTLHLLASSLFAFAASGEGWQPLLDEKLSRFDKFIGIPDPSVTVPGYTHAADPKQDKPIGLNRDPLNIFTVRLVDGEPVLHITGEVFGVLATRTNYGDFHLRVQFRWGTVKYPPRLDKPRDNGILYRCFGPAKVWSQSIECQVQENDIGDLYSLGGRAKVASEVISKPGAKSVMGRYTPGAPLRLYVGRCAHGTNYHELPNGEWNTIEIMAVGDRSLHILNGRVVNVLQDTVYTVDGQTKPLVTGQINFQSEGAECDYRRVEICPLAAFPAEYQALFSAPAAATPQP